MTVEEIRKKLVERSPHMATVEDAELLMAAALTISRLKYENADLKDELESRIEVDRN